MHSDPINSTFNSNESNAYYDAFAISNTRGNVQKVWKISGRGKKRKNRTNEK